MQLATRGMKPFLRGMTIAAIVVFTLFMVTARLLSGVHWFTDIIGGILLSEYCMLPLPELLPLEAPPRPPP
jgi:undecaprenyl-diphosphatase